MWRTKGVGGGKRGRGVVCAEGIQSRPREREGERKGKSCTGNSNCPLLVCIGQCLVCPAELVGGEGGAGGWSLWSCSFSAHRLAYIPLFCCWAAISKLDVAFPPFCESSYRRRHPPLSQESKRERERILFYNYTQRLSSLSSSSFVPLPRFSPPPSPKNERLPLSPFASSSSSFFSLGCFLGGAGERGKGRRRARFSPLLLPRGKLEGRRRRRRRLWLGHKFQRLIFSKVEGGEKEAAVTPFLHSNEGDASESAGVVRAKKSRD